MTDQPDSIREIRINPIVPSESVLVFKNFGPAAGASIAHTHSQVIAMPEQAAQRLRAVELD